MGIADEMALLVLGSRARSDRNCARSEPERTYLQFMVLEVMDCSENRHDGGHGHS